MNFSAFGCELLREHILDDSIADMYRLNSKDFTRLRKMGVSDIIYYCLNKKGLCSNMEINNFFEKTNRNISISSQALFDQRVKLSPLVFKDLNDKYLNAFYKLYSDEVRLFNNYVVLAIDGSDMEIPNTGTCIKKYGLAGNGKGGVARAGISVCYDVFNHYILDGIVDECRAGEIGMAIRHIDKINMEAFPYNRIYMMDRNYVSLAFIQYFELNGLKYLCRLKANSHYIKETSAAITRDEIINIQHTKHRLQRSRFHNEELFQAAKAKPFTKTRLLKYQLNTGEIEYLITNIEDFTYDDIVKLYASRWGIETVYFSLKQKLQLEKFTSSLHTLIEQDFFSSVLAYNIIQTGKNEAEQTIDQTVYKHEMRINENMAVGFVKNELISIMIEPDKEKRLQKYDAMILKISKYKVPIRDGRKFPIKFKTDNNSSINKLKSF